MFRTGTPVRHSLHFSVLTLKGKQEKPMTENESDKIIIEQSEQHVIICITSSIRTG